MHPKDRVGGQRASDCLGPAHRSTRGHVLPVTSKRSEQALHSARYQVVEKSMKRCSISAVIREVQTYSLVEY